MRKVILLLSLLWINNLFAADPVYTSFFSNSALGGYDAVAYFTQGKPQPGKKQFTFKYQGVNWLFSSAQHLNMFKANPQQYAPQYGGYCAWAVAEKNDLVSGDPLRWNIVAGKLYLNYDQEIQTKWQKNIPGFIAQGDIAWPKLVAQ